MILDAFGVLDTAAVKPESASTVSENVIYMPATDFVGVTDLWLVIDNYAAATGDASDTFVFDLVVSAAAALTSPKNVVSLNITSNADARLATAGKRILAVNIGKMLQESIFDGSTYPYLGLLVTVSAGGQCTINASLSTAEPNTPFDSQVTVSNVGVPS